MSEVVQVRPGDSTTRNGGDAPGALRLCYFIGVPPEEYSGATFHAIWLAQQFREWGDTVEFVTLTGERGPTTRQVDGFSCRYLRRSGGRFEELGMWWRMATFFLRHRRFDAVHVHSCGFPSSFVALMARLIGVPSIANIMIQDHTLLASGRLSGPLHKYFLSHYDRIVPISDETTEQALASGVPLSRIVKIPISVDVDRFRPVTASERQALRDRYRLPREAPVVAFVGALCRRKNILWLLDNWLARDAGQDGAVLMVVGDAADSDGPAVREQVQAIVEQHPERVLWVPFIQQIEHVYAMADVFVLPSFAEGMPTVVLQAMATGVPVLMTPVSGAGELVGAEGTRGRVFDFNDRDGFLKQLDELMADESARRSIGRAAREYVVENYSLEAVAGRYRALYEALRRR